MDRNNFTKEQARAFLKNEALKEITAVSNFSYFHTRVFYVFAKYGLLSIARQEELLSGDEWSDPDCKDFLLQKIKGFLDKHVV